MTENSDVPEGGGETPKGGFVSAIKCMISFFTIIRLDVGQKEFDAMERNFWAAPVIGFLNGLVAAAVCLLLVEVDASPFLQGVAALVTVFVFSKFLHFDGLTDFGDGMIVSSGRREDHVRALKDSLIGAGGFGVALTVVLISVACYTNIATYWGSVMAAVFAVEVLVKNAQVAAAAFGEPGSGMASRQVGMTGKGSLAKSSVVSVILLAVICLIHHGICGLMGYAPKDDVMILCMVLGLLMSVAVGWYMARTANRVFGFVNGDILGAANEISRAVMLIMAVIVLGLCI